MKRVFFGVLAGALVAAAPAPRAAAQGDRVLWRTRLDGPPTPTQFITRAPDGTIYTSNRAAFFALNPDGTVRWSRTGVAVSDGVAHSISLGADGTIHTGMGIVGDDYALVVALNPDGSTLWEYVPPNPGTLATGPNVGPDGNIYATHDIEAQGGVGAFSLDPLGNLRWSTPADPPVFSAVDSATTSDIEFGADRFHTGIIPPRSGNNPVTYTFGLDGANLWSTFPLWPHTTTFPVVDPFNRVILSWGQTGMRALSPGGQQEWFSLHPNGVSLTLRPAVDAAGIIYSGDEYGVELWALNPDGSTRYVRPRSNLDSIHRLGLSPDGQVLVGGGVSGSDPPLWVRGYAAADGSLLWQVDLPPENGLYQFVSSYEPAFSPDGCIVYVTTQFAGAANAYGYVLAIRARDGCPAPCDPDINCDGNTDQEDVGCIINAVAGNPGCECQSPDFNRDGNVDQEDVGALIAVVAGGGCP